MVLYISRVSVSALAICLSFAFRRSHKEIMFFFFRLAYVFPVGLHRMQGTLAIEVVYTEVSSASFSRSQTLSIGTRFLILSTVSLFNLLYFHVPGRFLEEKVQSAASSGLGVFSQHTEKVTGLHENHRLVLSQLQN